jgi:hypothetical protein
MAFAALTWADDRFATGENGPQRSPSPGANVRHASSRRFPVVAGRVIRGGLAEVALDKFGEVTLPVSDKFAEEGIARASTSNTMALKRSRRNAKKLGNLLLI